MKKSVILYHSKYGNTKKYADWLGKEMKCSVYNADAIKISDLKNYDAIVFGCGVYAGSLNGISFIKKNWQEFSAKKVIVFIVGMTDPKETDYYENLVNMVFSESMKKQIKIFHCRGGINFHKLSIVHRAMMAMLKASLKKKNESERSDGDKLILESYGGVVEFKEREYIDPIIEYVKSL